MSVDRGACLIIGAGGGIGSALVRRLAARGVPLVLSGRDEQRLAKASGNSESLVIAGDATDAGFVDDLVNRGLDRFGRLDGAVNCAGSLLLKPAHLTSVSEWRSTIAANLDTAFNLVRACARVMSEPGGTDGSIVLCSSAVARHGFANHEAIAAAKAGVIGLALSAAASYAAKGIRVNCVSPGLTNTPLTGRLVSNEASLKASLAMHADGRLGEPDDVASAIEWLLDPAQRHVTGQVISVDGGLGSLRGR